MRGASGMDLARAITVVAVSLKGTILGLDLTDDQTLVVRDYDADCNRAFRTAPIHIKDGIALDASSRLRMVFDDDLWGSTISFEPGMAVALDGSLELTFAAGVAPADLVGTTFELFDWDGVTLTGAFEIVTEAEASWDTSSLYTTGEVTLASAGVLDLNLVRVGQVNGLDVDPFVDVLLNGPYQSEADMNGDGVVNGVDVDPFVGDLVGGSVAVVPEPSALVLAMLGMIGVAACCRRQRR